MPGKGKKVAIQFLYIDLHMGNALRSVKNHYGSVFMSPFNQGFRVKLDSHYIADLGKCQNFDSRVINFFQVFF